CHRVDIIALVSSLFWILLWVLDSFVNLEADSFLSYHWCRVVVIVSWDF
ncbi:20847_t:CDS:2, partial [Gigaspora margarita]